MQNAFNLLVFHNSMFTPLLLFFIERAMCSSEKWHLNIIIIIIIMVIFKCYFSREHIALSYIIGVNMELGNTN